jgi:hypothetical protein
MDTLLTQLIDFIKSASPLIWEAFTKQVYAEALSKLTGALLALTLSIVAIIIGNKVHHAKCNEEFVGLEYFIWLVSVVFAIMFIALLSTVAMRFYNPNFYAIQMILEQLK